MFLLRKRLVGAAELSKISAAIATAIILFPSSSAQAQVAIGGLVPTDAVCAGAGGVLTTFSQGGAGVDACNGDLGNGDQSGTSTGTITATTGAGSTAIDGPTITSTAGPNTTTVAATGVTSTLGTNSTTLDPGGVTVTDGIGNTTQVSAGGVIAGSVTAGTVGSATINNVGTTTTGSLVVNGPPATALVSMGGNRIQNVGDPIAGTDAANKNYVDSQFNSAFKEIDETKEGIAVAIALGGIALPQGKNFAIAGNVGFYDSKEAFAAQTAIRLDQTFTLNGGVGVGFDDSKVGGRVGIMAAW